MYDPDHTYNIESQIESESTGTTTPESEPHHETRSEVVQEVRNTTSLVEYTDDMGRKFKVWVRDGDDPASGILVGPTPLDALGLPDDIHVRLHNELYDRGLLTAQDVKRNPNSVLGALQLALRVNVQQIQNAFDGVDVR